MRTVIFIMLTACSATPHIPDANGGPEHLPTTEPVDPSGTVIRLQPACDRLAVVPTTGYPPECCSWYCFVESSGGSAGDLETTFEDEGCVRGHECADFVCQLAGGGTLQFGVCVP